MHAHVEVPFVGCLGKVRGVEVRRDWAMAPSRVLCAFLLIDRAKASGQSSRAARGLLRRQWRMSEHARADGQATKFVFALLACCEK